MIPVDRAAAEPLHRQVCESLRQSILEGKLSPGARLPSSRALASDLGVSRNTVLLAFEQLLAEGYLSARVGSGTQVARNLPVELLGNRDPASPATFNGAGRQLSKRSERFTQVPFVTRRLWGAVRPFQAGLPALDHFPARTWATLASKRLRRRTSDSLSYHDPRGWPDLRSAIAEHLAVARGVDCEPDQVLVTAGTQQALDLCSRVLLDPGDVAWIEEPGYTGARAALTASGARVLPIPVDTEGLQVGHAEVAAESPRLIYVTPTHQFPTGVTMSLARRLELLRLAERSQSWILEDDYDSEFRFEGSPVTALQGLDRNGRVLYMGSFSKTLAPSLRLGFLVLPPDLLDAVLAARVVMDHQSPTFEQAVLADFLREGHFARHVRRMRKLYRQRRDVLVGELDKHLAGLVEVEATDTGVHLVARLPRGINDRALARAAVEQGLEVEALSSYHMHAPERGGLVLGYGAFTDEQLVSAAERLAAIFDQPGVLSRERAVPA
ncbi:MAG: GntR family transcriptional regulator [Planctomycetota bacterium]|nr:MAG: GntR family transcriptional regulator [Planctomycetota bacterium]